MAPVKPTEINISQRRSDNSRERRGDACWSYSCSVIRTLLGVQGRTDKQEPGIIKCWAKGKMQTGSHRLSRQIMVVTSLPLRQPFKRGCKKESFTQLVESHRLTFSCSATRNKTRQLDAGHHWAFEPEMTTMHLLPILRRRLPSTPCFSKCWTTEVTVCMTYAFNPCCSIKDGRIPHQLRS